MMMENVGTASLEALRRMTDEGTLRPTGRDAQERDAPEGFWEAAELRAPEAKERSCAWSCLGWFESFHPKTLER